MKRNKQTKGFHFILGNGESIFFLKNTFLFINYSKIKVTVSAKEVKPRSQNSCQRPYEMISRSHRPTKSSGNEHPSSITPTLILCTPPCLVITWEQNIKEEKRVLKCLYVSVGDPKLAQIENASVVIILLLWCISTAKKKPKNSWPMSI